MGRFTVKLSLLLCLFSLVMVTYTTYSYYTYKNRVMRNQEIRLQQITAQAVQKLNKLATVVMHNVNSVAIWLNKKPITIAREKEGENKLQFMLNQHKTFYGATITFKPYGFIKNRRLFSSYYFKKDGKVVFQQLDRIYDYTKGKYSWYGPAMQHGSRWSEPYYDDAAKTLMITYSSVFYKTNKKTGQRVAEGMVTTDISLNGMKLIVESLPLGIGGYGSIVSADGIYLYHPTEEYALDGKTLLDIAKSHHDNDRRKLAKLLKKGGDIHGIINHVSVTTSLPSWVAYQTVPEPHWLLINTFIKKDVQIDYNKLRDHLIWVTLFSVIFLVSLFYTLIIRKSDSAGRLWILVLITTIVFLVGIVCILNVAMDYDPGAMKGEPVVHPEQIQSAFKKLKKSKTSNIKTKLPIVIKTGVLVQSVSFINSEFVVFSGQVWQRLGKHEPSGIEPGFSVLSAENVKITMIDKHTVKHHVVIRWHFQASVRQQMRYRHYPFEREDLNFSLAPKDTLHHITLIPDLSSYNLTNPAAKPGLGSQVTIPGWSIQKSYFDLPSRLVKEFYLNSNGHVGVGESQSVLRFNIEVQKHFLNTFVSNQFPLIVVSIILFALLITATTEKQLVNSMQTHVGMVLSMCSALIFVVVFSHIGLRQIVVTDTIFYLEYYYFVMYVAILGVAMLSIICALDGTHPLLKYKYIKPFRYLYWPLIFGVIFIITMIIFY